MRSTQQPAHPIEVCICIVAYNTKELLEKCLTSIKVNTQVAHEIIVVDNNSKDGTQELLKQKFPKIKTIFNKENKGFAKAANQAVKLATGNYVLILNPDTEILTGAIDKCLEFAKTRGKHDLVTCKIRSPNGSIQKIKKGIQFYDLNTQLFMHLNLDRILPNHRIMRDAHLRNIDYDKLQILDYTEGCFMMINRAFFETVGLFDEDYFLYSEDCDLCRRITRSGGKIYYFPEAEIIHFGGESTKNIATEAYRQFVLNRFKFYQKNFGDDGAKKYRLILAIGSMIKIMKMIIRTIFINAEHSKYLLKRDADTLFWSLGFKRFEPFIK